MFIRLSNGLQTHSYSDTYGIDKGMILEWFFLVPAWSLHNLFCNIATTILKMEAVIFVKRIK